MTSPKYITVCYPTYDCYIRHDIIARTLLTDGHNTFTGTIKFSEFVMNTSTGVPLKDRDGTGIPPESMGDVSYSTIRESALKEGFQWTKMSPWELLDVLLMEEV